MRWSAACRAHIAATTWTTGSTACPRRSIGSRLTCATRRRSRASQAPKIYSVAVCGEQLSFDRTVTLPQLHWDFRSEWDESEFFIAPTHMNCDRDLDGDIVATVERFGVPIAYVKDRRAIVKRPVTTVASPLSSQDTAGKEN